MYFNGNFFEKLIETSHYSKPNETMAINKYHRSTLTFEQISLIGVPSEY